jgi:hypothetical protein
VTGAVRTRSLRGSHVEVLEADSLCPLSFYFVYALVLLFPPDCACGYCAYEVPSKEVKRFFEED